LNDKKQSFIELLLRGVLLEKDSILGVDVSPCIADPDRIKFMAKIDRNLDDILPILFLSLPNSRLTKNPPILSFTVKQHNFMIGDKGDLAVTYVKDKEEVAYINDKIIQLINKGIKFSISNNINIDSMVERKRNLTTMTLYELFPKTNCKECGEETCFNYAAKIMAGEKSYEKCPYVKPELIKKNISPIDLRWDIF
jgi:ArsR family metal-binding transcriptional regulator